MKYRVLLIYIFIYVMISSIAFASELPYPDIKEGGKIKYTDAWTDKIGKKETDYYTRTGSLFTSHDLENIFDTGCSYIFIYKGNLIGYSDLRFYEFTVSEECVEKRELLPEEVEQIFDDFKVIKISEFSSNTNVYIYKRTRQKEKIIVLNDTSMDFSKYNFYSNNAKFDKYPIRNAIDIKRGGTIQFLSDDGYSKDTPVYVLLVR